MTFTSVAAPGAYAGSPKRGPVTRLLEDERWLAMVLLLPTLVLLGLFIAYPFFKGVELSVTDTKVGVPGHFVGLQNFEKIWNDSIFHVAVWNTCLYTFVTTVFKLALGLWLALLLNHHFKGKATIAIWRSRALERSLSGEFAFQCKFERLEEVPKESIELSEEFYRKVQLDCAEWIKLGTTKTAMVYGLGEGRQPTNHE